MADPRPDRNRALADMFELPVLGATLIAFSYGCFRVLAGLFDRARAPVTAASVGGAILAAALAFGGATGVVPLSPESGTSGSVFTVGFFLVAIVAVGFMYGVLGLAFRADRGLEPVAVGGALCVAALATGLGVKPPDSPAPFTAPLLKALMFFFLLYGPCFAAVGGAFRPGRRIEAVLWGVLMFAGFPVCGVLIAWFEKIEASGDPWLFILPKALIGLFALCAVLHGLLDVLFSPGRRLRGAGVLAFSLAATPIFFALID